MKFCEKIREARKNAGLKQDEFAKAIGVSLRTVSNYESGERYPKKRETYYKIAEVLKVDVNYLIDSAVPDGGVRGNACAGRYH